MGSHSFSNILSLIPPSFPGKFPILTQRYLPKYICTCMPKLIPTGSLPLWAYWVPVTVTITFQGLFHLILTTAERNRNNYITFKDEKVRLKRAQGHAAKQIHLPFLLFIERLQCTTHYTRIENTAHVLGLLIWSASLTAYPELLCTKSGDPIAPAPTMPHSMLGWLNG